MGGLPGIAARFSGEIVMVKVRCGSRLVRKEGCLLPVLEGIPESKGWMAVTLWLPSEAGGEVAAPVQATDDIPYVPFLRIRIVVRFRAAELVFADRV